MTASNEAFQGLGRRLVGDWTSEATHPALPGTTVYGTASIEWLEGERFLLWRAREDHPDFPDSISVLGDTDGLKWHYFDSRGIHRVLHLTVTENGLEVTTESPGASSNLAQSAAYTLGDDDGTISGLAKLRQDDGTWADDLAIAYHRTK